MMLCRGSWTKPRTNSRFVSHWARWRIPLAIGLSRIFGGVLVAHFSITLFPQAVQRLPGGRLSSGSWLGAFDRWDSAYYTGIAAHGYRANERAITAFFPGYSLLVRAFHAILLGKVGYATTATVVSWVALVLSAILLWRLVEPRLGGTAAWIATIVLCWSPASVFFLAPYSEALFLLEILIVVSLVDRHRFLAAAVVAAAGSATSPLGLVLTAVVATMALFDRRSVASVIGYVLVSASGIVAYMLFLWVKFSSPLEFVTVEHLWHRSQNFPFYGVAENILAIHRYLRGPGPPAGSAAVTYANIKYVWILDDLMLVLAGIVLSYVLAQALIARYRGISGTTQTGELDSPFPASWLIVFAGVVLIAASTSIFPYGSTSYYSSEGEARWVSVAFPMFVGLALFLRRRPFLAVVLVGLSVVAALAYQLLFNLGYWLT